MAYDRAMQTVGMALATLALLGTSLFPLSASADEPLPIQATELSLTIDGAPYACVTDPSSWRAPTDAHNALVDAGYTTSVWIGLQDGVVPFSDQLYVLCRPAGIPA